MKKLTVAISLALLLPALQVEAQSPRRMDIQYADIWEFIFSGVQDTTFVSGSVIIEIGSSTVYCDSAMWAKGELVMLWGRVTIDDPDFRLVGDSVRYNLVNRQMLALGDYVELWSRTDSLFAVGNHAFFDRDRDYFYMLNRPTVYLNYPDSSRMVEVVADFVEYDAAREVAEAEGNVTISSNEFSAAAGCAVMHPKGNALDLFNSPIVKRKHSEITGRFIAVTSEAGMIRQVDVVDSAYAEFVEPINPLETDFDRSILSGQRMLMDFMAGDLRTVTCYDQAYSWYYPAPLHDEEVENSVSGDTIRFTIANEQLRQVEVVGGAIGTYLNSKFVEQDSALEKVTDTIDYNSDYIQYSLIDSIITLTSRAGTTSGPVALEAYKIQLDTKRRIIEAYSAELASDTATSDNRFDNQLQPNAVPVLLKDGNQHMMGDYLEYSLDTEKGRIVTSKSQYQTGFFYGEKLHRQQKDVFYLENGIYTTCDADEPHFHFESKSLKLINDEKLIAKPVVLCIGRLPILAVPYYVFPLKKGRHSGLLPFTLGNIEKGEFYIRNVGYYWAASEYWDWQGALDYYDERDRLNLFSKVTYKKRYAFDGSISGNWGRETVFDARQVNEFRTNRWTLEANHSHQVTPSFRFSAQARIQSDPNYYNDFSDYLPDRLNRIVRSSLNFSKKFSKTVAVSGTVSHDDYLDTESRTDHLPTLSVTLPSIRPFGSGKKGADGSVERHWYNNLIVSYRNSLENYSSRKTVDSLWNPHYDTAVVEDTAIVIYDTVTMAADTTITYDTTITLVSQDTLSYRSRKEYTRVNHSVTTSFPLTVAKYFIFNPSLNYSENWMKVHATDQAAALDIDPSPIYRGYKYSAGASLSTKLFGTIYPNLFGLAGLRQVLEPSVNYRFTPEIDLNPIVSSYTGGSARSSSRSQNISFSLRHLYQAKVRRGEEEKNYDLLSVTHSFSYNFEKEERKFSSLTTTIRSNLLRNIQLNSTLTHDLYKSLESNELDLLNPHMTSFNMNATVTLNGSQFIFDDVPSGRIPRGLDSASQVPGSALPGSGIRPPTNIGGGRTGWDMSATLNYNESGKWTNFFRKSSSVQLSLHFSLTPTTQVSYSQYYDFVNKKTITNQVSIVKNLHCWTGIFHWVPTGSTRGWGFRLFVTALPAIKIDNSESAISSTSIAGAIGR